MLKRIEKAGKNDCAEALFLRGEAWRQAGKFKNALAQYNRGLKSKSCDRELRLGILIKKTAASRALGQTCAALKAALSALALARATGLSIPEAELELALAHRLAGNFGKAEPALKRLYALYGRLGDWGAVSYVLWALGGLWRLKGRYKLSIKAFEDSARFAAKAGDKAARGYALCGLGGVNRVAGRIKRAFKSYKEACAVFAGSSDIFARAYAECGMSNVLRQLGRLDEALKGYRKAHKFYSAIRDGPDLGFVEWGIGEVYKKRGELAKAEGAFRRAERLFSFGFGRFVGQRPL
jgi:tetratricopeptide (TPR) repeat protein